MCNTYFDIFIHLHKTGGQTISEILKRIYKYENVYAIKGTDYKNSINDFKNIPQAQINNFSLLTGHQFYGLHTYSSRIPRYFTMVREPLERTISLYNYLKNINYSKEFTYNDFSIVEFVESNIALAADNGMTRFIGNYDLDTHPYQELNKDCAKKALNNISKFAFIGLYEDFDKSLISLSRALNWKQTPYYNLKNKTRYKYIIIEELNTNTKNKLKHLLETDIYLYNNIYSSIKSTHVDNKELAQFRVENQFFTTKFQITLQNYYYLLKLLKNKVLNYRMK